MKFENLNIMPTILKALSEQGYTNPTPIQEEAIPLVLNGGDLLGCAQTGTGKTAAFAVPILQLLSPNTDYSNRNRPIRALVITPTRELALQIHESFCSYGKYTKLKSCVIFGGVSQKGQEDQLKRGIDILIATPGRLNDLYNQKLINFKNVEILVLDEADRMLDMGFIHDVKKIIALVPLDRQTLLFSATMPKEIEQIAKKVLKNPVKVQVTPESSTVDTIQQYIYYVDKINKKDLLIHILKDKSIKNVLVFSRTKHGADRIVKQLFVAKISAKAIHGDKSQGARQKALSDFKDKSLRVLVATDIAARGIDIDELTHVINYDLPEVPETYVHRIGRTGRAGRNGTAISFCDYDEKPLLKDIEKLISKRIETVSDHPYPLMNEVATVKKTNQGRNSQTNAPKASTSRDGTTKKNLQAKPHNYFQGEAKERANKNKPKSKPSKPVSMSEVHKASANGKRMGFNEKPLNTRPKKFTSVK